MRFANCHVGHQRRTIGAAVRFEEGEALGQLLRDGLTGMALTDHALGFDVVLQQLQGQPPGRHGGLQLLVPADLLLQLCELTFNVVAVVHGDASAAVGLAPGHGAEQFLEFGDALLAVPHGRNDRASEQQLQGRDVDADAAILRVIHHVQDEGHGLAQLQKLGAEVEVALQVGGVQHVQDQVHFGRGQEMHGHPLILAAGGQRVGAREVHHLHGGAPVLEGPAAALHGDARPVADMVPRPGERVEEGGLAAVRIAREGDGQGHQGTGWTRMQELSSRLRER